MADATVLLNLLLPLIEKKVREEVNLMLNTDNEVLNLSEKLKKIVEVLEDAERRLVKDPRVRSWLQKLQEIAYEIEDYLEEWEVKNFRQQLLLQESDESWEKKVYSFLESIRLCFKRTVQRRGIALNVKDINRRLDSLAQENENKFNFIPNLGGYGSPHENHKRIITNSFVEVSEIKGRDDDKNEVISMLLSESSSCQGERAVNIVSIVGAGGLGKTTLAQLIYNEMENFDVKIWVCVSDPFNEISVHTAILEKLDKSSLPLSQSNALLEAIKNAMKRRKFFLVLDDVWTDNKPDTWNSLKLALKEECAPGSSILVTTRKESVAYVMGSTRTHALKPLDDMDCWLMLSQIAFDERNERDCRMLEGVGKEIAKKCKGLPLAAKAMGSYLRLKRSDLVEWTRVLESELWQLEKVSGEVFHVLGFSYNELSPNLRRCFSYCALFPKDSILNVGELVRIWIAQGFLSPLSSNEGVTIQMDVKGYEYFKDLAMRSFFQEFEKDDDGHIIDCKMHDIVHDFAQYLTKNEIMNIDQTNGGATKTSNKDVRHLSVTLQGQSEMTYIPIDEPTKLRSLLCKNTLSPSLLIQLQKITLLIVKDCDLKDIPKEIGNLIHIKYLDISRNKLLKKLPETICDLYYLQTLDVHECLSICGFPQGIHKLVNLRYLLNHCEFFGEPFDFPQGLEKLTNLIGLGQFYATKNNKLGWLEKLNQLGGELELNVDNEVDEADAKKANLKQKESLEELKLNCWKVDKLEVVEALKPHPNLQILDFWGPTLPKWLSSITNLKSLEVHVKYLAPDTITNLRKFAFIEYLKITCKGMMQVGLLGKASFPQLKTLEFFNCHELEEWEDISGEEEEDNCNMLPLLQTLTIWDCPKLKALPHRILSKAPLLTRLYVSDCDELSRHYKEDEGGKQEWHKISSHIAHTYILLTFP